MPSEPGIAIVELAEIMDVSEAVLLAARLQSLRGRPVKLDASRVRRVGGMCLQVLLSARKSWAADAYSLTVANPSADFTEAMAHFGASQTVAMELF